MEGFNVAVVGATGLVGREFIKVLEQRNFPMRSIRLLASDRSAGTKLYVKHEECEVKETTSQSFSSVDIALFSAGAETSTHYAPIAARAGAIVIDNSSAFRMDPSVPLVVPEVNPDDIKDHKGIIANPNCSTIQMVVALSPLHKVNPIKRIVADTYQSASGIGSAAMEELGEQSHLALEGREVVPHLFPHQIAFNVLPEIDLFLDNGYTKEEWKLVEETQKIMHAPEIAISATAVRVPVSIGHSEAIHVEFTKAMSPQEARQILAEAPGVKVLDDPAISLYPHPWSAAGTDEVFVGRIRKDASHDCGLALWVVADNIRKGAALNAVQIAETVIARGWIRMEVRDGPAR
ncbi:MAG: aspartate-semialdehyde dehydrogenase [Chloroflexota bacterium]|nr:aspartate-semialdehyde dehydrogenase [Chloroflexota bacterium]